MRLWCQGRVRNPTRQHRRWRELVDLGYRSLDCLAQPRLPPRILSDRRRENTEQTQHLAGKLAKQEQCYRIDHIARAMVR